jgi:hypothetical protein
MKRRRKLVDTATQERTQERTARTFEQAAAAGSEAAAVSLGVTQRLIGSLTELSVMAAKENARLAAELQTAALDALHDTQSAALRWQPLWSDAFDPMRFYQRGLAETLDSTERALNLISASARLMVQAADRMQSAATDTGQRIRETLHNGTAQMREATRR